MKWNELSEMSCPIARSLALLGDRWTLLIIRNAFLRTRRFDDFQKQIGMTRHLLTDRLNRLVDSDILSKVLYQDAPKRYEYRLTERGLALYPVMMALSSWGNTWLNDDHRYPELIYVHHDCNHETRPIMMCTCCQRPLSAQNTRVQMK